MIMKEACWKRWYFSKATQDEGGDGEIAMQIAVTVRQKGTELERGVWWSLTTALGKGSLRFTRRDGGKYS